MARISKPPRFGTWILKQIYGDKLFDEVSGDLLELYSERLKVHGSLISSLHYYKDVVLSVRNINLSDQDKFNDANSMGMFKNYLKSSYRNLLKNPLSSFINVFGLATSIGCTLVVYAFVMHNLNVDQQHIKKDRLFMVTPKVNKSGESAFYGESPVPIGLKLEQDFPQVKRMTRIADRNILIKHEENVFYEYVRFVDPAFQEMFTFPLHSGNPFIGNDQIVLGANTAIKYFGNCEEAIDRTIKLILNEQQRLFTVIGVAKQFPVASSIRFDFLIHIENLPYFDPSFDSNAWDQNVKATFIEFDDPSDMSTISLNQEAYLNFVNGAEPDFPMDSITYEPLTTLHDHSNYIKNSISRRMQKGDIKVMIMIAIFLISLACLNYLNIAITSATKRLKEIGIRKVIGANRRLLIIQFVTENILFTSIALIVGYLLAITILIPGFQSLLTWEMEFEIMSFDLYLFLIVLLLITAIASGLYPAIYISKFPAITIFRGGLLFGRKNLLSKILLTLQFTIASQCVVFCVINYNNAQFLRNQDWGYNQASTIVTPIGDFKSFEIFKKTLVEHPDVNSVSGSREHLGYGLTRATIVIPTNTIELFKMDVDEEYVETMGLRIISGRNFSKELTGDRQSVLINEKLAKNLKWLNPIDKTFSYDGIGYKVIGILEDFHYSNFTNDIEPVFIRIVEKTDYRYMSINAQSNTEIAVFNFLQSQWSRLFPETPFGGKLQKQVHSRYFEAIDGMVVMSTFIGFLSISLACFGLFGLISLNVAGRIKEFSIRKVLGANVLAISKTISSHFTSYLMIALSLAGFSSYNFADTGLETIYNNHMPVTFTPIFLSLALIFVTVIITISSQIFKVISANPTVGLRNE